MTNASAIYNYSPVGDLLVVAVCISFAVLLLASYVSHVRSFRLFRICIALLSVSALANVSQHLFLEAAVPNALAIYILRGIYHLGLFSTLLVFIFYAAEALYLERLRRRPYILLGIGGLLILTVVDIVGTLSGKGFRILDDGSVHMGFVIFPLGYCYFVAILLVMIALYRNRIYIRTVAGVAGCIALSFAILFIQGRHGQYSFTAATFLFPSYAILYLLHSSPYDQESGAVNYSAFEDLISYHHQKKNELILLSLLFPEYDGSNRKLPSDAMVRIRDLTTKLFKGSVLFAFSSGHLVLVTEKKAGVDYTEKVSNIEELLKSLNRDYHIDFRAVLSHSVEEVSEKNDYLMYMQYFEDHVRDNEIYLVQDKDVEGYRKQRYILSQLADIHATEDMDDPRVLVYCQPVYNIRTGRYDTAEALMRLTLPDMGMVFPDQFIPLAERYNYIPVLTMIIFYKTCMQIRKLIDEGYYVRRISVNFSMLDLREPDFCDKVSRAVEDTGIPFDTVAIELTESQNERDFQLVKERMETLKESGMKFYLDDFGTGYSNFERIMEIPFDIIKFDRSLVIASAENDRYESMVSHLARMFSDMDYAVLYEGVENEDDEERCISMFAKYLQGYKYSKPIPIEQLKDFFSKSA